MICCNKKKPLKHFRLEQFLGNRTINPIDSYFGLFQRRCHELEEANVQTKILLESSQADKNHISRVMQQNEKLKNEFQELQLQLARVVSIKKC